MFKTYNISLAERNKIIDLLREILIHHDEIEFSYVYGSFSESIPFRDIDIAVYYSPEKISSVDLIGYEQELACELQKLINIPVDVRVINYAPLGFKYYATCGRVLTCKDEEFRCDFIEQTWIVYLDYKPKVEEFLREMYPLEKND